MKQDSRRGAVLLTTLLVMSIMAVLAIAMMDDIFFAAKRTGNVQDYAQNDWYVKGVEAYAGQMIRAQVRTHSPAELNQVLRQELEHSFAIDDGQINIRIVDGSHCLSLGALVGSNGAGKAKGRRQLAIMAEILFGARTEARQMAAIAGDWADRDGQPGRNGAEDGPYLRSKNPYRTANTPFTNVQELRALTTMNEAKYQILRPFVCARQAGRDNQININTMSAEQAPLLAAILGDAAHVELAGQILLDRPDAGYGNLDELLLSPALQDAQIRNAGLKDIDYKPRYFWVEAEIKVRQSVRVLALEYELRDDGKLVLIDRGYGAENLRPQVQADLT